MKVLDPPRPALAVDGTMKLRSFQSRERPVFRTIRDILAQEDNSGKFKDKPPDAANVDVWWTAGNTKALTVICSAHKFAMHMFSARGRAGSPQVQSSTRAGWSGRDGPTQWCYPAGTARSLSCNSMCETQTWKARKMHNRRGETRWYTHTLHDEGANALHYSPLAENEGTTKISSITSYLMEALGSC